MLHQKKLAHLDAPFRLFRVVGAGGEEPEIGYACVYLTILPPIDLEKEVVYNPKGEPLDIFLKGSNMKVRVQHGVKRPRSG
jgi:hypothetical protein